MIRESLKQNTKYKEGISRSGVGHGGVIRDGNEEDMQEEG